MTMVLGTETLQSKRTFLRRRVVLSSKTRQIRPPAIHNHTADDLLLLLYVMAEGYSEL
jgi:hypothetical protein